MKKIVVLIRMLLLLIIIALLLIVIKIVKNSNTCIIEKNTDDIISKKLEKLDIDNINNIMIVAHPDDELLWGGAHLIEDEYLVVCVTCGENEIRQREFENAMKNVNCPHISLGYPDRNTWESYEVFIKNDLYKILNYKKYKNIVTHNPNGEYGHNQHIKVSNYVTFIADKRKLQYFDNYYTKEELDSISYDLNAMSDSLYEKKLKSLEVYKSQMGIVENHKHTIMYENFIPYEDWYNNKEEN